MKRIHVFIDADNVSPTAADQALIDLSHEGRLTQLSAFANFSDAKTRSWKQVALKWGVTLHQRFNLTPSKNAADIALAARAVEAIVKSPPDLLVILSDDVDFQPVLELAREHGVMTRGYGTRAEAKKRASFDEFAVVQKEVRREA